MNRTGIILTVSLLFLTTGTQAQFYSNGDDPAGLKWNQSAWDSYRIIYPRGLDSLASVYGNLLENFRHDVSRSTGMDIDGTLRHKFPIVLHGYGGVSNGAVAWAPRRMELFTLPNPYDPDALQWEKSLAIHESRHVSQMLLGYRGVLKPLSRLTGDFSSAAASALYAGNVLLEGDAVVAETALTESGRGRDGDFLNYYMSAFDSGDRRNWYAWRYGSWRRYAPDHYALGYMTVAGTRVFCDDPLFMAGYFKSISRNPLRINNMRREIRRASGMDFNSAWHSISDNFSEIWSRNAESRKPYTRDFPLTEIPSWYEAWRGGTFAGDTLLAVKSGLLKAPSLEMVLPSGKIRFLRPFAGVSGKLAYDACKDRLYWGETVTDARWQLKASSVIRYMELSSGKVRTLAGRNMRLYNPVPSDDGKKIAVVEYPAEGGSSLLVISAEDGSITERFKAPDGLQLVEPAWDGGRIVTSGLSEDGMGLYSYADGKLSVALPPAHAKISGVRSCGRGTVFASDRNGVNEIYMLEGHDVLQLTSGRYGAKDPLFHNDTLYYTSLRTGIPMEGSAKTGEGLLFYRTAAKDLLYRKVNYEELYRDPVAEELSRQEKELAEKDDGSKPVLKDGKVTGYAKAAHLFRFHSWIPLSVEYDGFSASNFDDRDYRGTVGATAFFQNDLGTASGYLSYGYETGSSTDCRHSVHMNMTYSGLYPVIELKADLGGDSALRYQRITISERQNRRREGLTFSRRDDPQLEVSLRTYVPLRFNSGGWLRGLTPSVSYKFSNALYCKASRIFIPAIQEDGSTGYEAAGKLPGKTVHMHTLDASLTGYIMREKAPSAKYPEWGIGAQAGYSVRPGLSNIYTPGVFGYLYGYVPGLMPTQGLKLTALLHHRFDALFGENTVSSCPRGFAGSDMNMFLAACSRSQLRLGADYALQFGLGEKHLLSALFHPTRLLVVPHADLTLLSMDVSGKKSLSAGNLYSVGADVLVGLANIVWIPYGCEAGISLNWNGGKTYSFADEAGFSPERFHAGLVFNISF